MWYNIEGNMNYQNNTLKVIYYDETIKNHINYKRANFNTKFTMSI